MKVSLPLMKNIVTSLTKSVLIPLGLAEALATNAGILKIVSKYRILKFSFGDNSTNNVKLRNESHENKKIVQNNGLKIYGY